MARRLSNGAELQSVASIMEQISAVTGTPDIETTTVRSGAASFHHVAAEQIGYQYTAETNPVIWARAYLYINTAPNANNCQTLVLRVGLNRKVSLRLHANRTLELWNEEDVVAVGSPSAALSTGQWYRLELHADCTTLASTAVEARIDGAAAFASGTINLTAAPNELQFGASNFGGTVDLFYDDIAVNDSTDIGDGQNSWPGEGELIVLRPNAAGDNADWTRGGTDSGANWSQTDETTPNDVTDYVQSNTAGQIDDYNLSATPAALESTDEITLVQAHVRFAVDNATGGDPDFVVRLKSGANVTESAAIDASSTTWRTNSTVTPFPAPISVNTKPGGGAWTKTDLDAAQVGVRESVTDTHFARVSALWVYVEHKPAGGGGGTTHNLSATIAAASGTPDTSKLAVARSLSAVLAATSATDDGIVLAVSRPLSALLSMASGTPDDPVLAVGRSLSATLAAASGAPDTASLVIARSLSAELAAVSGTPDDAVLSVLRDLVAGLGAASGTPDTVNLVVGGLVELAASMLATSGTPDGAVLVVARSLAATLAATSGTPDDAALAVSRSLAATLGAASGTPDTVTLSISGLVELMATMAAVSGTPDDAALAVSRSLAATLGAVSGTPDTVTLSLGNVILLAAAMLAVSATPDDTPLAVARPMTALLEANSATPDISLDVARLFVAAMQAASATPDTVSLVIGGELADALFKGLARGLFRKMR